MLSASLPTVQPWVACLHTLVAAAVVLAVVGQRADIPLRSAVAMAATHSRGLADLEYTSSIQSVVAAHNCSQAYFAGSWLRRRCGSRKKRRARWQSRSAAGSPRHSLMVRPGTGLPSLLRYVQLFSIDIASTNVYKRYVVTGHSLVVASL